MKPIDVVILTEDRYLNPKNPTDYIRNILIEDQLVQKALENEGLTVKRYSWSSPEVDWNTTKYILFRSTWDYFDCFDEFSVWLEKVSKETILLNSEKIIRWNIDKHYLADLENAGIPVVESYYIEKGDTRTLTAIYETLSWKKSVLKPCVSGAGRHTYLLNSHTISAHEEIYTQLIANEAMILQPFMEQIVTKGEISLMVMNGTFTHAIQKKAKAGDFRVQDDFGGTVHPYTPSQTVIEFAERAIKACFEQPMYARVDIIWDNEDKLAISELELVEPELWFRYDPAAATELAKGIKKLC